MQKELIPVDMPYMKFMTEYFSKIAYLDEKQKAALLELIGHKMGKPCGERSAEELMKDVPTAIVFESICEDIDKCAAAYSNKCETNRENGKKGGRPKKKRPEPEQEPNVEEPNESKLSITNSTESGICIILYDDKAYGDSLKKLKNKEKVADLIGYAAIYLSICDNCDYEFIYDCTEKSYSDYIDEMRKMALGAFGGNNAEFTKAFANARDYAKLAMKCDRLKLGAAIEEYNERQ